MKLKRTVPELITNAFLILLAVLFVAGVTPDRTGAFAPFLVLPIFFRPPIQPPLPAVAKAGTRWVYYD